MSRPSHRRLFRSIAIRTAATALVASIAQAALPNLARADDLASGASVQTAPTTAFTGSVNANDVYVRSGPADNYYATLKLDKGAAVTVVGIKFDWLKIVPPAGSFCYVSKAYVEKRGDGTVGRVTKPELNVRVGSSLNAMKSTIVSKLDEGVDVQIIGDQDEYFKIKPPAGSYLYVNKQFVDPVRSIAAPALVTPPTAVAAIPNAGDGDMAALPVSSAPMVSSSPGAGAGSAIPAVASTATTQPGATLANATTQPAGTVGTAVARATTQPAEPGVEARFDSAEADFLDATNKPLEAQPLESLMNSYVRLTASSDLPVSMRHIAEMRISTLKARQDVRDQYVATMKMEAAAREKELALRAEQQELQQRVKDQDVTMYTAVGTLRSSSLQSAGGTLYRLTDPGTGRTLLYVRSDDPKYAMMLNQFVGVRGTVNQDASMSLKVLAPTLAEAVDVSKVNTTVTAEVIPPTLMPKAPTASIGD